ncbi:adenosine receptor A1 [Gouania willdenowi]|uniref:Adenosine receptor A3 n=1 Tax=Gouania willdenowi TaxID=441366 RepID=A0A8C5NDW6_GOUWI|nr:adenosine receptor A1-like [Gouania willdenowi]XP_028303471.1 adenosine receptor A1-like [Gouania willdenowi]XP_028303472.1 adenosine receptor A1-like [Gouania willdenowi]
MMSSSPGIKVREHVDMVYISMETAIAVASVMGNVLVVLVVCVNRALRDTTFSFIVSLAVADIAVGVLVIPLAIIISLGYNTHFYTCLFFSCLLLMITQSSILSLLAIAIDRYLRVKIPTRYSIIVTQGRVYVAVCLCWILSFLTGLVPMIGWNNHDVQGNLNISNEIICEFTTVMRMDYMVYFNFFGLVVTPLTIMIILYAEIFRMIRRQLNRRAEATCDGDRYFQKELKLAKSLALVVLLFIVCWLPIHVMNCISFFYPKCHIPKFVMYIGIFMSHVNSALNPMVYAFRIKRFRMTLIQITHRCMFKPTTPTPCPTSTPGFSEKVDINM